MFGCSNKTKDNHVEKNCIATEVNTKDEITHWIAETKSNPSSVFTFTLMFRRFR